MKVIKLNMRISFYRFAKNLSSNSINVSTLRGEGELYNLELNEKVLTDLLELPNWMLISQASVNRVSLKIQWTKLKSTPIHLVSKFVGICFYLKKNMPNVIYTIYNYIYYCYIYSYICYM